LGGFFGSHIAKIRPSKTKKLEAILIFLWYESFLALVTPVDSLNERFEMKRDGEFFIQKTKAKSTRKYFISLLLMKIHK
jgi:hypothetical protein